MKRLTYSCSVLLILLILSLSSGWYVNRLCSNYTQQLKTAQQLAIQDDWTQARSITQHVFHDWTEHSFLLHALLRHSDTDQILISFRSIDEYLQLRETDQYLSANAVLITQLELLAEMEQPTLENVL